jgi:carbamoyltransferase
VYDTILGINTEPEALSAAVVRDGVVVSAIEQFKIRQHWSPGENAPLPKDAIATALHAAGLDPSEVDVIAFASDLESAERLSPHIRSLGLNATAKIEHVDLRLAHSAAAFYTSPFDRAAILVLGSGSELPFLCLGTGDGVRIELEPASSRDSGLVTQYCRIYRTLGFHSRTSNKLAWLGSGGTPEFLATFREYMSLSRVQADPDSMLKQLDFDRPSNIAASLQLRVTELVIELGEDLCRRNNVSNLCVAGNLAENPLLVRDLERHFGAEHVFVPPAPGLESLSIGAALVRRPLERRPIGTSFPYPALGPKFSDSEIKSELDNCKLVSNFLPSGESLTEAVARTIADGGLVGWFQGRCEFGHRALGFRSILANPFTPYVDENINRFLKHRERFHPFVISVPEEDASGYFLDVAGNARTIASVYALNDSMKSLLSPFTVQNTFVRVHTVRSADNQRFWALLRKMKSLTGHPLLINTSFNLPGEPLVMTPRDAIRSFYASGLDVLAMGHFLVRK